jgi:hypothetical protein
LPFEVGQVDSWEVCQKDFYKLDVSMHHSIVKRGVVSTIKSVNFSLEL